MFFFCVGFLVGFGNLLVLILIFFSGIFAKFLGISEIFGTNFSAALEVFCIFYFFLFWSFGSLWQFLNVLENFKECSGFFRNFRKVLCVFGNFPESLADFGSFREFSGNSETFREFGINFWEIVGICGSLREVLVILGEFPGTFGNFHETTIQMKLNFQLQMLQILLSGC